MRWCPQLLYNVLYSMLFLCLPLTFLYLDHILFPLLDSECVVVSDSDPDPTYWIQSLEFDLQTLEKGKDVTEKIINASQIVLKMHFKVQGLQCISNTQSLQCNLMPDGALSIQIHHTGTCIWYD